MVVRLAAYDMNRERNTSKTFTICIATVQLLGRTFNCRHCHWFEQWAGNSILFRNKPSNK